MQGKGVWNVTISSPGVNGVLRAYSGQKVTLKESKDNAKAKTVEQDQVVLSSQVRDLKQAMAIVATKSAVRESKVAELTIAIKEGRYKINPEKIADSILKTVRQYGGEV